MATFDPTQAEEDYGDLKTGTYEITLAWLEQRTGRESGKKYYSMRYDLLDGSGRSFFTVLSCQVDKGPVARAWAQLCKATGVEEAFEVDDEKAVEHLFLDNQYVSSIIVEKDGEYDRTNIKSLNPLKLKKKAAEDDDDLNF